MSKIVLVPSNLSASFQSVSSPELDKKPTPFSLRLTRGERAALDERAGNQPLGAYIREQLLSENNLSKRRRQHKPKVSDKNLSLVLALLGDQRIAANLNQLAKHANMGTLDVDDVVLEQIQDACAAMIAVRDYLLGGSEQ